MRTIGLTALTLLLAASPAFAAGSCRTDHLTCATTMPEGGYCECTARGQTEDGTVVSKSSTKPGSSKPPRATAGGCGAQPNAPGCR